MKMGAIGDVSVRAQVVVGETLLSIDELASMAPGSIIELESLAGEPVDLVVAGERVARGEVVVIDENFGIRVTELVGGGGAKAAAR